ncbi:MAG: peptidase M48 [Gammaproteobacteria bacterium]|nr:MAG: peptidase M48 [Gammaproteobacteria bacterium]
MLQMSGNRVAKEPVFLPLSWRAVFASLGLLLLIEGCAVNPVTGSNELTFVSEAEEIQIGRKNYLPAQQSQGGQYRVDQDLTAYVSAVGWQLARVSDRPNLPYEFVILNSSVPNAWAMPGGKIVINRGLLLELDNEAELAAVIAHEIVHAAARHGAKGIERGLLLQAGVAGIGIAVPNSSVVGLLSNTGAQLINQQYGRGQELESDYYGMLYMSRAGYDTSAAISLQEKFVKLSKGRKQSWLEGMFASHPPSEERVQANRERTKQFPIGGKIGRDEYQRATSRIRKSKEAYKSYDKGQEALKEKRFSAASKFANRAIAIEPDEALFSALKGDILAAQNKNRAALDQYKKAIQQNSHFFAFYLQQGTAQYALGLQQQARGSLEKSNSLLPTPPAHYFLGELDLKEGKRDLAVKHYRAASVSKSEMGSKAAKQLARLELPDEPGRYIASRAGWDSAGRVIVQFQNRSQVKVQVTSVLVQLTRNGRVLGEETLPLNIVLSAGKTGRLVTGLEVKQGESERLVSRVVAAKVL